MNYRKINDVSKKDPFHSGRIGWPQWFFTLDLVSGYWQVEVHHEEMYLWSHKACINSAPCRSDYAMRQAHLND